MYSEHYRITGVNKNMFVDFIAEIHKRGHKAIVYTKTGDYFSIYPNRKIKIMGDNFLKIVDDKGFTVKIYDIDYIVGVADGGDSY